MIEIDVPGFRKYQFSHLVLDVNGTIATDGGLIEGVAERLAELRTKLSVHLVTADTHGRQQIIDAALSLHAARISERNQAQSKLDYIKALGPEEVAAIGNGANDAAMLECAALGIVVIGQEGCAAETLLKSDAVVRDIRDALDLLLYPKRLIATLRR